MSTSEIKFIIPPGEIKDVIYKTAWYVLNKGPEFERMVKEKESANHRFSFLNPNDPYYPFYQKVKSELLIGQRNTNSVNNGEAAFSEEKTEIESQVISFTKVKSSRVDYDYCLLDLICEYTRVNHAANSLNPYSELYIQKSNIFRSFSSTYETIIRKALNSKVKTDNFTLQTKAGGDNRMWIYPKIVDYFDFHSVSPSDFSVPKNKLDIIMMSAKDRQLYFKDARFDQFPPLEG